MTDVDPLATQRGVSGSVAAELAAAGFDDAVEIGRGGFGAVYRCAQSALDRIVAVKILAADLDEENRARFFREQRAAGRLTGHPNIVNVLQVGVTDEGRPFIVMPYYPRGSLEERIRHDGPLPLEEALRLGVKMAGALEAAHRSGVLHRDVKPGNILLTDYGEPALTDFGIAHVTGAFVTATGVVTGTPAFTAPEVVSGKPPSRAADVYSLGATLFAALTGHAAFERRTGEQLVAQFVRITAEPIPDPRAHGVSEDLSAILEQAMSPDPDSRPSATRLGEQLQESQLRHGFPVDEMALHTTYGAEQAGISPGSRKSPSIERTPQGDRSAETPSGRTGRLPLELTSFVDRRAEQNDAKSKLSTSRLVTLTGIGGVGKTRLAVRVANNVRGDFPDGVTFVELGELRDESLLVGVVARAVGVQDRSVRLLHEALVEFLAPRKQLLVLDNCEQMVTAVAHLAESLLRVCPDLRILATSREPIGLGGEAVLPVLPLAVPDPDHSPRGLSRNDAITLFAERAAAVVAGFEVTDDNRVTIARICQRLDGLPLPIELATARLRAMSPEQILQRLSDRYALLTRGSRGAPSRQQTLRMCIDWSYDLCTPDEQRVWAGLSVFSSSFELEAAQYVCGVGLQAEEVLDIVASLVDKSILTREESRGAVRFRMLDTVRDYGLEKARQTGEYPDLRRRHRDWYERLVRQAEADWVSPRELAWLNKFSQELPNVRQVLEFCVSESPEIGIRIAADLFPFWHSHGSFSEGRRWLDRFLACEMGPESVADRAGALCFAIYMAGMQGDVGGMVPRMREERALVQQTTSTIAHAYIDLGDGLLALFNGSPSDARPHLERAERVLTEYRLHTPLLMVVGMLALTYALLDDVERTMKCYEHGLEISQERGESYFRTYLLWVLAIVVWRDGDHMGATRLLEQALQVSRRITDRLNAVFCLQTLAWIAADQQDFERAIVLTGAASQLGHSMGSPLVLFPDLLSFQEECERKSREAMSEKSFTAARREGAALGFEAAVAYALGEDVSPMPDAGRKLTKREREVAELVADGLTNKQIAARLVISPRTAQGHIEHLLTKLEFTSRAQIAAWVRDPHNKPPEVSADDS
ncbi:protein kinase domain-containing protein [Nocardia sp. R7R-8]|uniref:protein kinase domain-containing protein n=1 Tax=Nocardia sp. R7R-8 TaxID=3459304 RepID=UPI00403DB5FD